MGYPEINHEKYIKEFLKDMEEGKNLSRCIYGENHSGKTYLLKEIYIKLKELEQQASIGVKESFMISYLIPTNRLGIVDTSIVPIERKSKEESFALEILEAPIISRVRHYYLEQKIFKEKIEEVIEKIFNIKVDIFEKNIISMSDGIQNVINIYAFLFYLKDYYEIEKENDKFKAVVFIDELELYLHINAQIKFYESLKRDFPAIMWIYTTHSPIFIQKFEGRKYEIISNHNIKFINRNHYFKEMDDILQELFHIDKYPEDFNELLKYIEQVKNKDIEFDEKKYCQMIEKLREKHSYLNDKINHLTMSFCNEVLMRC